MEVWRAIVALGVMSVLSMGGPNMVSGADGTQTEEKLNTKRTYPELHTEEDFDVQMWAEERLGETYKHLADVDIYMVKPEELSVIYYNLMKELLLQNPWLNEPQVDCVVVMYIYGGMSYLYNRYLHNDIRLENLNAFDLAIMQHTISMTTLDSLQSNDKFTRLTQEILAPFTDLLKDIGHVHENHHYNVEATEKLFYSMDHTLHQGELRHILVHKVVAHLIKQVYHWLDTLDLGYVTTNEPCHTRIEAIQESFTHVIAKIKHNLQVKTLTEIVHKVFGTEATAIIPEFAKKISMGKALHRILHLLQTVQFEKVAVSMDMNEFIGEHTRLHQMNQTIFGFIIDFFLERSERDYFVEAILGDPHTHNLPFDLPMTEATVVDMLPALVHITHNLFEMLPQECLDSKMLSPLAGVTALKRPLLRASNPLIMSVISDTWKVVTSKLPEHQTYQWKTEFWLKIQEVLDTFYMDAVHHFAKSLETFTGGQLSLQTLGMDTLTLIHTDLPDTLGELCREVVEIHVKELLDDIHCHTTGVDAYNMVILHLEHFTMNLHMEPAHIEGRLCEALPVLCKDPALAREMSLVLSSSFVSVLPDLMPEVRNLFAMWFIEGQPLSYYRSAFANFIATIGAKFIHLQYTTLSTQSSTGPPDDVTHLSENMLSLTRWQHHMIENFLTSYFDRLSKMPSYTHMYMH